MIHVFERGKENRLLCGQKRRYPARGQAAIAINIAISTPGMIDCRRCQEEMSQWFQR